MDRDVDLAPIAESEYEKLGVFYLGRRYDLDARRPLAPLVLYPSKNLTTHAVCIGMTGSGKTGLCLTLVEEAAIDGVPVLAIDPKGDLANLCLTFPTLDADHFAPWVEPGTDPAAEADRWARGLAAWGQDAGRIRRLRDAVDLAVYTPGSSAGLPLSIVKSLAAPPAAARDDADLWRDRVTTAVSGLLALTGLDGDPVQSREHVLLSTLVDRAWRAGADLDLARLVADVQRPPIDRVGALDLESFFPAKERQKLALQLNNLIAAPGFASWMEGAPLDVQSLLWTPEGKPRVAVISIAHLSESERMFFVTLLFGEVLAWTRAQRGTSSLRAIVYMDEVMGYFPPVANPPSKRPLLTLLKQARAFGVGVVLATQNPVDLDYKGLGNAGTWFLGRLQTARDKARVLDGLEGAAASAGHGFDRAAMERTLSALGNRVFLLHDVREEAPIVFQTRWTLSYLRGPLSRDELRRLKGAGAGAPAASTAATPSLSGSPSASPSVSPSRPVLPAAITERFIPVAQAADTVTYEPHLVADLQIRFFHAKLRVDHTESGLLLAPLGSGPVTVDWSHAAELKLPLTALATEPAPNARFAPLPADAANPRSYARWSKELAAWMIAHQELTLFQSPSTGEVSRPGESESAFRARLAHESHEDRDADVDKLRAKYAPKLAALDEKLRRARQAEEREADQAKAATLDTALTVGASVLGSLFGGRRSTRAITSGVRATGRAVQQSRDVKRAQETVAALEAQRAALAAELDEAIAALGAARDPATELFEPVVIRPRKVDVTVRFVALAWKPA